MPPAKSMKVLPSTSVSVAPSPRSTKIGIHRRLGIGDTASLRAIHSRGPRPGDLGDDGMDLLHGASSCRGNAAARMPAATRGHSIGGLLPPRYALPDMPAALVTGGSSGIGRAIAADLLAAGWDVTIVSRDPARAGLDGATCVAANLASEDDCVAAVSEHRARVGRLDLLVSSAGIGTPTVDGYPAKAWDLQFAVNIRGLYLVTREALPMLREARGLIVNIASVAGLGGAGMLSAYAASKHAVVGYTRTLNEELLGDGVRATAICPAFVDTPMTDWVKDSISPEDMIQPADVARTVRYLLDLTPACHVPEIAIHRATRGLDSMARWSCPTAASARRSRPVASCSTRSTPRWCSRRAWTCAATTAFASSIRAATRSSTCACRCPT